MYSRHEKEIQNLKLIAGGRFSSFGFAEVLALRVGAKPNVLNVCWQKKLKCAVGKNLNFRHMLSVGVKSKCFLSTVSKNFLCPVVSILSVSLFIALSSYAWA